MKNTDTPRTDAIEPQLHSNVGGWVRSDFARQLERELAHSLENQLKTQAEIKELKESAERIGTNRYEQLKKAEAEVAFWKSKAYEAEQSEGKHEAEVERLDHLLADASAINHRLEAEVERMNHWKDNLISNLMALEIYEHKHENDPAVALAAYGQWQWSAGEWEKQAEVERLQNGFQGSCYCCEPVGEMNQKLEAEVEKLKTEYWFMEEALNKEIATLKEERDKAIEIADKIWADCSNGSEHTDLAALKSEIK